MMKKNLISLLLILVISGGFIYGQNIYNIKSLIEKGELSSGKKFIKSKLLYSDTLSQAEVKYLKDELSRIEAIIYDYPYTYNEMFTKLKKEIPDLKKSDIEKWEKNKSLEYKVIDGKKFYFWAFSFNLFALNKEAEKRKIKEKSISNYPEKYDHITHKNNVIREGLKSKSPYVLPKKIRVSFTFFEDVSRIPEGEIIRGWLPVPREIPKQTNIKFLAVEPNDYIISNKGDNLNASIYVEKLVIKTLKKNDYWKKYFADPTEKWVKPLSSPDDFINKDTMIFRVVFEYIAYAYYCNIDPQKIANYDTSSVLYKKYTKEELPHIKFTDYLLQLSKDITEGETNNYLKARKIYEWVCRNITWTNPDYSSPNSLSEYIAKTKRGDCGSKALLFITLCRLNGIPARVQGGWMTRPFRRHSQHGWAQMYIEPCGWLTVDTDAGSKLINSQDEKLKYFHFGNCDSYRLIIYDDNIPLFPYKVHGFSSGGSIVAGLQLGAFEWSGGEIESNVKIDTYVEK